MFLLKYELSYVPVWLPWRKGMEKNPYQPGQEKKTMIADLEVKR